MKRGLAVVLSAGLMIQPCMQAYGGQTGVRAGLMASGSGTEALLKERAVLNAFSQETQQGIINLARGESIQLEAPADFTGEVVWKTTNGFLTVGSKDKKRPLNPGETDSDRSYGQADASHLASVSPDGVVTGHEKGNGIVITATDSQGKEKTWTVNVSYYKEEELKKGTKQEFKDLRTKYVETLTGKNNDMSDPAIAKFVKDIDKNAQKWWDSYEYKDGNTCESIPWQADMKTDLAAYLNDAVQFRVSYQHVEAMAKAYATTGSQYYKNKDLLADIVEIMDWLSANCYYPRSQTDNWWTWEIGIPKQIFPICMYIYDDVSMEKLRNYVRAYEIMQPDPFHSGSIGTASTHAQGYREATSANKMDCAYTVLGLGLVLEDPEYLQLASDAAASTMTQFQTPVLNADGSYSFTDGFYEDGSYIDHGKVPYVSSYGVEMLTGSINIINLLAKTTWSLSSENVRMLQTYVTRGYIPAVYKGAALDMLRGRAISRPQLSDRDAGGNIISLLVKLLDVVDSNTAKEIKQNVKYWITEDTVSGYVDGVKDIAVLNGIHDIMADNTIDTKEANRPMHQVYPLMDRTIHRTEDYLFGISMYSSRIQNCEVMNSENLHGWFTGSGMTYLYNQDLDQYTTDYWNTVNPFKLPGTTVVPVKIGNGAPDGSGFYQDGDFLSPEDWVGGTSIGVYGVSGMALNGKALSNGDKSNTSISKYADHLRAKKSYFMFDDEIVCLGAGISNSGSGSLNTMTTVENRKIRDDGTNQILIDGVKLEGNEAKEVTPTWIHMEGNTEKGSDIGYYFPESQKLMVQTVQNSGSWKDIKADLKAEDYPQAVKNYFECWFEHGTVPVNAAYSYAILPNLSAQQTQSYAQAPRFCILENSEAVQAVKHDTLNILAANIWTDETVTADNLSVTGQSSVMVKEENGKLRIAVADSTMKNTGNVVIRLTGYQGAEAVSSDSNVSVLLNGEEIELVVNVNGKCGFTSNAEIKFTAKGSGISNTDAQKEGAAQTDTPGTWELIDGSWKFKGQQGRYLVNQWVFTNQSWYYIGIDGKMLTGWNLINGNWYYLKEQGEMATGRFQDRDGTWYELGADGALKSGKPYR